MSSTLNGVFPSSLPEESADLFITNKEIVALGEKGNVFLTHSIPMHIAAITILVIVALAGIAIICLGCYSQSILLIAVGIVLTILTLLCLQALVGFIKFIRQLPQQLHTTVQFIREKIRPESSLQLVTNAQRKTTQDTLKLYEELCDLSQKEFKLQSTLYQKRFELSHKNEKTNQN
ncbi:cell division protein ZapA [Chlamydia pneumoniae]|uniref:Uncharacterized protein n=1 Tax=Chlamydia pneumoniae TaxID=83558 RepID=Q9Z8A4_CHLPN|nr:cell division protein ZapA [Chlamydia pneumoniae]AAD18583.1 hypothetical protein CPn_0439 [Chlamydia pneumoniae CWL029]AAF38170.1 hypothetical protein CP_0314 [Chlamydia pneumoniae AR39]CRI32941.1 Uncharacterized protein BN1224_Wien1_A_04480 [Chlamydia pneumoniae]CRI35804.1 Uncharacterized protein BN1224_CM1_A_04510 [Chlamydia pneumoniae]CRI36933.1 Uncharacterized protein BN1224_CV14_A_04520 [Chlamydia pneumoniae]